MDRSYDILQVVYDVFNIGKILLQNSTAFFTKKIFLRRTLTPYTLDLYLRHADEHTPLFIYIIKSYAVPCTA